MLEHRCRACFATETPAERWIDRELRVHDLHGHFVWLGVLDSAIHRSHGAFAKNAGEAKTTCQSMSDESLGHSGTNVAKREGNAIKCGAWGK